MSEPSRLDRTFSFILKRMVKRGQAPFYMEIAAERVTTGAGGSRLLLFTPGQGF